jgi:hypothetical protein
MHLFHPHARNRRTNSRSTHDFVQKTKSYVSLEKASVNLVTSGQILGKLSGYLDDIFSIRRQGGKAIRSFAN